MNWTGSTNTMSLPSAWSRLGDAALAEEVAQEVFIRAYRRLWLLSMTGPREFMDGSEFHHPAVAVDFEFAPTP